MSRSTLKKSLAPALLAAALAAVLSGCAAKPVPAPVSLAPTADQVQTLRQTYKEAFPNAKIGVVTEVLGDDPYAMVSDIDTAGIKEGDYVSFVDAEQSVVAGGTVIKVNPSTIAVMFEAGSRRPINGDAAVKF